MKQHISIIAFAVLAVFMGCESNTAPEAAAVADTQVVGQSGVKDDVSNPNVVQVAVSSADHTTLVAAVKAAGLVDALSNAGPFTVFAPTNAAFDKLPPGTVEGLLKPDQKDALKKHPGVPHLCGFTQNRIHAGWPVF